MHRAHVVYCFGAFELDPATRQVTSGAGSVYLTDPQWALLLLLVTSAPDVVDKDALAKAGWGGAAISPNSIEQAISALRRALNATDDRLYIETVRHRGYRFVEPIRRLARVDVAAGGSDLEPFRAFLHGSRELATLNLDAIKDKQRVSTGPYPAVGLHLLHGLVLAAKGRLEEALREFDCELDVPDHGQLYARERAANTWYARGAVHLRRGEHDAADASFRQSLGIEPRHYSSMAALGLPIPAAPSTSRHAAEAAIAHAIQLARQGRHPAAAETFGSGLQSSPASHAGWILPVEPILNFSARPDLWSAALTLVQQRAS